MVLWQVYHVIYLFSKNLEILPFARTPGTGSKNRDGPWKIRTLGRPGDGALCKRVVSPDYHRNIWSAAT